MAQEEASTIDVHVVLSRPVCDFFFFFEPPRVGWSLAAISNP